MAHRQRHIYLVGIMGCGKSTVGKQLAQRMGYSFVDLDAWIVAREGRSVADIFASDGEAHWRALERKWLNRLSHRFRPMVLATGGGVVIQPENIRRMRQSGRVVWIDRSIEDIVASIDTTKRPLLKDGSEKLHAIFAQRRPLYRKASHIRFANSYNNAQRAAEQLQKILNSPRPSNRRRKSTPSKPKKNGAATRPAQRNASKRPPRKRKRNKPIE